MSTEQQQSKVFLRIGNWDDFISTLSSRLEEEDLFIRIIWGVAEGGAEEDDDGI